MGFSVKALWIRFDPKIGPENQKLLLLYTFRVKLVSEVKLATQAEMVPV